MKSVVTRPANRLAKEIQPSYLLLHAHNPVRLVPVGRSSCVGEKPRAEKKLIFLSIGYSSCYWCHVMERESFMDDAVATYLNEHFVCIKVDREERPDIDHIYMTAAAGDAAARRLAADHDLLAPDVSRSSAARTFPHVTKKSKSRLANPHAAGLSRKSRALLPSQCR